MTGTDDRLLRVRRWQRDAYGVAARTLADAVKCALGAIEQHQADQEPHWDAIRARLRAYLAHADHAHAFAAKIAHNHGVEPETPSARREQADKVMAALLEGIHTLIVIDTLITERPGDDRFTDLRHALGPWADNVQRSVAAIEPLRPLLVELVYGGAGLLDSPAATSGPASSRETTEPPLT
ncbi:hypothetical protein [Nonomuraea sp. LPB2021202275-12-8]|uniref:hypothetical protein n=1 Tax=Nonomuraea sp. LPB2021202275-12-8 TaxID=3120159 RepID=UPI00300C2D79